MLGNAAEYATSCTQHCVTLSTTEEEYVALAEGAKEGMFEIGNVFHATQFVRNYFDGG